MKEWSAPIATIELPRASAEPDTQRLEGAHI